MRALICATLASLVLTACGGGAGGGSGVASSTSNAPASGAAIVSSASATTPVGGPIPGATPGAGNPSAGGSSATGGSSSSGPVASTPAPNTGPVRTLSFAGRTWAVKDTSGNPFGPGPNVWSGDSNTVYVDSFGWLHLRVWQDAGVWKCAEVYLTQTLGYGSYVFTLASDVSALDPSVVLGLFTWSYGTSDPNNREMDIEFSRWGVANRLDNAAYTVQPDTSSGNQYRWSQPTGLAASQHSLQWSARQVNFSSAIAPSAPYQAFSVAGLAVPASLDESIHINLWLFQGQAPSSGLPQEVVITGFSFSPA